MSEQIATQELIRLTHIWDEREGDTAHEGVEGSWLACRQSALAVFAIPSTDCLMVLGPGPPA